MPTEQEQRRMATILRITVAEMIRLANETSWEAIQRAVARRTTKGAGR